MNTVFRPKGNLVWASMAFALDALFIIQTIFYPGESGVRVLDLLIAAALAAVAYLLCDQNSFSERVTSLL